MAPKSDGASKFSQRKILGICVTYMFFVDFIYILGLLYFTDFRYICGVRDHQRAVRWVGYGFITGGSGDFEKHDPV